MKKKNLFRIRNNFQAVISGILSGLLFVIALVCILAVILVKFDIPSENVKYLLIIPSVISGLISGGITARHVKSKGFLWGGISGLSIGIILTSVLLIYNMFFVSLFLYLLIPASALSGSFGGIVSSNLK